ncbi:hypothetical protein EOD42_20055 [Rhodovarius crocodyli]|uniref:Uncharacterized protein n=1 Tax=Rhodovarius crocodyli TaxID=1979269 RepID=A0A437M2V2_9PROT|nr:hypothetical protein [Rhodovarius crocodyli]RVT92031.1 hypothetical protein EOD42_20055 [Rhodovarius crocodyli]
MRRRSLLLGGMMAAPALMLARPLHASDARRVWFDPAQLPSYSGRLERWLINPAGEIDRALLKEGTQIIFPATESNELVAAIRPGDNLITWGVRARNAPVVTMLAWGSSDSEPANFVRQPSWFAPTRRGGTPQTVTGRVAQPLLTPQGEAIGVILDNGAVVRLAADVHAALGDKLGNGAAVAASGPGSEAHGLKALDAERLGTAPDKLEALPQPERRP